MTLDEAIIHAEEVMVENWEKTKCRNIGDPIAINCFECAEKHRQLAEWLKELKQLKEQTRWIPVSERLPEENGWYQCTVILNLLPRTMEFFYKNGKWLDNRRISMFDTYEIYGYGNTNEKHELSYQELISEFDWTIDVIAWKPLSEPYKAESEDLEVAAYTKAMNLPNGYTFEDIEAAEPEIRKIMEACKLQF